MRQSLMKQPESPSERRSVRVIARWREVKARQLEGAAKRNLAYLPRAIASGQNQVFVVQWHVTDRCNFRCKHCYDGGENFPDLSTEAALALIDNCVDGFRRLRVSGVIALAGGEPFTRPDLFRLVDRVAEWHGRGFPVRVSFLTNGWFVDDALLDRLNEYRAVIADIQISLDGASAKTHDHIRRPGSFDQALRAISLLRSRSLPASTHFVVSSLNREEAVPFFRLSRSLGVGRVTISRLVPEGRGKNLENCLLSPESLRDLWAQLYREADEALDAFAEGAPLVVLARARCDLWHLTDEDYSVASWSTEEVPTFLRVGQRCPVGQSGITVMSEGTVYPCRRLPLPIGNLTRQSFSEVVLGSDLLWKLRFKHCHQKGKCRRCRYCVDESLRHLCSGGAPCLAHAVHGDLFAPDPQCWYEPDGDAEASVAEGGDDSVTGTRP